jgi:GTP-binding protein
MRTADVRFVAGATSLAHAPRDGKPQVALIGPSNVGKSSLLNAIVGHKGLARVSRTPGRTQQLNFFLVEERFYLVDLPGYGFADAPRAVQAKFRKLVEEYLAGAPDLRLLFLLLDARRDPSVRDTDLLAWLRDNDVPHAVVLTKSDKLSHSQVLQRRKAIAKSLAATFGSSPELLATSAVTGAGHKELWSAISAAAATGRRVRRSGDSLPEPDGVS